MRKLLCILLASCLMVSLVACDGSSGPSGGEAAASEKIAVFYIVGEKQIKHKAYQ